MEIKINLNDILGDEYGGAETLQESIRRQVIDGVSAAIGKDVKRTIDEKVGQTIQAGIDEFLKGEMPKLFANIVDSTYVPVDSYGRKGDTTSFRSELVKSITANMVYKKANYDSDKNCFTRAVDDTAKELLADFKTSFNKKVDADFTQLAMDYATQKIKERLGIK